MGRERAGRGCEGNVRRGLSGGGRGGRGGGYRCARRGGIRAPTGQTQMAGGVSGYGVVAGASRAGSRVVGGAHLAENCLERAFASERLAEKTGAPAGALRPWLVANRASELLSAMTMAAAPPCPAAFLSPPQARFGARLERSTVVSRPTLDRRGRSGDARRRTRASRVVSRAAGRAFSRDASGDDWTRGEEPVSGPANRDRSLVRLLCVCGARTVRGSRGSRLARSSHSNVRERFESVRA